MPSLDDLWMLYLSGDQTQATAQLKTRPALTAVEAPALLALNLLRSGPTRMFTYTVFNPNTSVAVVQLFNAASTGAVTLGTTVPTKQLYVPAGAVLDGSWDFGPSFPLGLVATATTAPFGASFTGSTTALYASFGVL